MLSKFSGILKNSNEICLHVTKYMRSCCNIVIFCPILKWVAGVTVHIGTIFVRN